MFLGILLQLRLILDAQDWQIDLSEMPEPVLTYLVRSHKQEFIMITSGTDW